MVVLAKVAKKFTNDLTDVELFLISIGLRVTSDLTNYRIILFLSSAIQVARQQEGVLIWNAGTEVHY